MVGYFTGDVALPEEVPLLFVIIANGNIPECALPFWRDADMGPLYSDAPDEPCSCYYQFAATGIASCTACDDVGLLHRARGAACRHGDPARCSDAVRSSSISLALLAFAPRLRARVPRPSRRIAARRAQLRARLSGGLRHRRRCHLDGGGLADGGDGGTPTDVLRDSNGEAPESRARR